MKLRTMAAIAAVPVIALAAGAAAQPGKASPVDRLKAGQEKFDSICGRCHGTDRPLNKELDRKGWKARLRAYLLHRSGDAGVLKCHLAAGPETPVRNLALLIRDWGERDAALTLDGRPVPRGKAFRTGQKRRIDGTEAELWIGLKKLLKRFDREWYNSLKGDYPSKKIDW